MSSPWCAAATLVGAVSRQNILEALAASGNSYVQGVMTRSFQTALPDDSLVKTLRRIMGEEGAQLVPVMEGERIVGIVTPQNLSQSMGLLNQSQRMRRVEEQSARRISQDRPRMDADETDQKSACERRIRNIRRRRWRPGSISSPRPSATLRTSPCARCACCGR